MAAPALRVGARVAARAKGPESSQLALAGGMVRKPSEAMQRHGMLPANPESIPVERGSCSDSHAGRPQLGRVIDRALHGPGEPLSASTRAMLEPHFGRDFGEVRVHDDEAAGASARAVDALAFTVGNHIVFDRGRYAPETVSGRRLLIHELAHVVQQGGRPAAPGEAWSLGSPSSAAEHAADATIDAIDGPQRVLPPVLAARLAGSAAREPVLQRAIATWGGEWDTSKYNTVEPDPADPTIHGVDIDLKFTPKDPADATEIGIVQKVVSKDDNGPIVVGGSPTLAARTVPAGGPGAGSNIDRVETAKNPVYPTSDTAPASHLWESPTVADWGHNGYHHKDSKGVLSHREALLKDEPRLLKTRPNASQTFEDTAMAITGVQTGATYGTVQWGWKTNAAGNVIKLPLTKLSDDVVSGSFKQAQTLWNQNKNSAGEDLIKFYTASRMFVQADNTPLVSDPKDPATTELAKLSKNTRIEVINKGFWEKFNAGAGAVKWWKIAVTEGSDSGKTGWVQSNQLGSAKVPEAAGATP
jgi:hypothetical protein